jgi:hypothetical protein
MKLGLGFGDLQKAELSDRPNSPLVARGGRRNLLHLLVMGKLRNGESAQTRNRDC